MSPVALQLFRIPDVRNKILTTLGLLVCYRIGFHIPIPGMSTEFLRQVLGNDAASTAFGLLSAFSGGAIGQTAIFGLGIMPYISASIIFSILGKVSPQIEALQKEGASGQKKINQWTRLSTIPIAILQALFIYFGFFAQNAQYIAPGYETGPKVLLSVVLSLVAGAIFVMWLGELISEYGLGNGASVIIMANIIATMPAALMRVVQQQDDAYSIIMTLVGIWALIVFFVVYIQKGERRIPIQYARLTRGRRVYGGQRHYLPLKINMAGVMPIIFASALFIVPGVVFSLLGWNILEDLFNDRDGFIYVMFYVGLVFGFCFFWNNLMFRPDEIADNLREHGSFVPGIRPGAKTAVHIKEILTRITLAGAVFLAVIAVIPNFVTGGIAGMNQMLAYFLGGTSVLIVVGVALDLVDRLNAQLTMRNYEGFVKGSTGGGGWAKKQ